MNEFDGVGHRAETEAAGGERHGPSGELSQGKGPVRRRGRLEARSDDLDRRIHDRL